MSKKTAVFSFWFPIEARKRGTVKNTRTHMGLGLNRTRGGCLLCACRGKAEPCAATEEDVCARLGSGSQETCMGGRGKSDPKLPGSPPRRAVLLFRLASKATWKGCSQNVARPFFIGIREREIHGVLAAPAVRHRGVTPKSALNSGAERKSQSRRVGLGQRGGHLSPFFNLDRNWLRVFF